MGKFGDFQKTISFRDFSGIKSENEEISGQKIEKCRISQPQNNSMRNPKPFGAKISENIQIFPKKEKCNSKNLLP